MRQGINVVFKEPIYKLLTRIWDKSYYKKPFPMGGDPKKRNQWWKCLYHEEKWHGMENCRALKSFLDYLVQAGNLKEYVDQEKTKVEEVEIRPNTMFDRNKDEADNALKEDLSCGNIHMIGDLNHLDLENRILGEIRIVRQ